MKHHCLNLVHTQKLSLEYFTCCQSSAMGNCLFSKHSFYIEIITHFFGQENNFPPQNIFSTYLFYQRYLETGNYKGFLPTVLQFLKQHYNMPDSNILPWQIYTPKDVQLQSAKTSTYMSGNPLSHTHCN